jgi:GAF domain-containing protein
MAIVRIVAGELADERALAELFAATAQAFHAQPDRDATLRRIARGAVDTVPGCDYAGLMLVGPAGGVSTRAATDEILKRIDAIQYQVGTGPCLAAIRELDSYVIDDLSTDPRWPEFGVRAAEETSVRSMMSFQLASSTATLGALNLYSRKPEAFDGRAHAIGAILAAHAAVAVSAAQQQHKAEHLDHALASSRQIGVAMGILMAYHRCTEEEAFLALRNASNRLNIKLRDVAAQVVQTGDLVEDSLRDLGR